MSEKLSELVNLKSISEKIRQRIKLEINLGLWSFARTFNAGIFGICVILWAINTQPEPWDGLQVVTAIGSPYEGFGIPLLEAMALRLSC